MATKADGSVTIKIDVDGKEVEVDLEKVKKQIKDVEGQGRESTETLEDSLTALHIGLAAVSAALIAAGVASVEYAKEFNAAFAKTQTIMDENAMSASQMHDEILALSNDSAMAATDVSEAVYQAISGSVDTADAVGFVQKANMLAVSGFTSLTNATDILTTTLNAYKLSADKVGGISNVLIKTQNLGKTSVNELSASMGKAIATGSAYGVNLQNIATMYVELTKSGIATAESTTYMNSMMNELGDAGSTVGKILQEKTGKTFGQLMQDGQTLGDVLQVLSDTVNGDAEAFMGLWGSQEAGKAANAVMVQSVEDFNQVAAQMNSEMSGVTGTTEQAYETMTNTSEFIDKRFNNALTNLAIAYGETLTPAIDKVKTFAADFLEGLTAFVQKNPAISAAFTGLATAVVVLAGGYAALMIAQKAKAAVAALNATLNANPVILVASAVAALAVGIGTLVASAEEGSEYLKNFDDRITGLKDTLEHSVTAVDVNVSQVGDYVARLKELKATGLKTTEQQEEYHEILVKLTETIPELSSIIDLETDSIKGGTDAILANTDAWAENAKAEAYRKHLADLEAERTQALIDQAIAEKKLKDAREAGQPAIDAYNKARREGLYAVDDEVRGYQRLDNYLSDLEDAFTDANDVIDQAQAEYDACSKAVEKASEEYGIAADVVKDLSSAQKENAEAAGAMGDIIKASVNPSVEAMARQLIPGLTEQLQALQEKYGQIYDAALTSLQGQFKLWEEAETVTATSVESVSKGIQSQIDYWNDYNDNLQAIKDSGIKGIDQLYEHISDGSKDSVALAAGIAEELAKGNKSSVKKMIKKYEELQKAQDETATSMSDMKIDMDEELSKIVENVGQAVEDMAMPDAALDAAKSTMDAYIRGLLNRETSAEYAARRIARATANALYPRVSNTYSAITPYASGTDYASPGISLVGENGPELVLFRGGERVLTAEETRSMLNMVQPDIPRGVSYTSSTAPAATGGGASGGRATIIVPLTVDGREFARATVEYVGEELDFDAY